MACEGGAVVKLCLGCFFLYSALLYEKKTGARCPDVADVANFAGGRISKERARQTHGSLKNPVGVFDYGLTRNESTGLHLSGSKYLEKSIISGGIITSAGGGAIFGH